MISVDSAFMYLNNICAKRNWGMISFSVYLQLNHWTRHWHHRVGCYKLQLLFNFDVCGEYIWEYCSTCSALFLQQEGEGELPAHMITILYAMLHYIWQFSWLAWMSDPCPIEQVWFITVNGISPKAVFTKTVESNLYFVEWFTSAKNPNIEN